MALNFDDGAKYMDLVCEMAKVGQSRIINFEILGNLYLGDEAWRVVIIIIIIIIIIIVLIIIIIMILFNNIKILCKINYDSFILATSWKQELGRSH